MKRILYCHQYFLKPTDSGGTRSYYIANAMIDSGMSVTVITSDQRAVSNELIRIEKSKGMEIYWIACPYHNSMRVSRRLWAFLKYSVLASYLVFRIKNYDVIYATSTPLTVGVPALIANFIRRKPYVFEVRDLWPEFPIQMGAIRSPIGKKLARGFEKLVYSRANTIIALSPGMLKGVLRVSPNSKAYMVPNMSKPQEFAIDSISDQERKNFGLESNKFRAVYFGTMGRANNIEHLLKEALYAQSQKIDIEFVLVGDGAMESMAKKFVENHRLQNVIFMGRRPMIEVAKIVSICSVSIVSFSRQPILETNSPNKFFDSLSASKPCVINISGWIRDLIEKYDCGEYVNPDDAGDLIRKLEIYMKSPEKLARQGANARQLCLDRFDRDILCGDVIRTVEQV